MTLKTTKPRWVVCAAIRNWEGDIICSARHWDNLMRSQVIASSKSWQTAEQGFIDQFCVFMNRQEAMLVAKTAGQTVDIRGCGGDETTLYSEGLY